MKKETWLKKPTKELLAKLEKSFNYYIRLRDSENRMAKCISCGKPIELGTKNYQAGHYVPVAMSSWWRFEEDNVNAQCGEPCNGRKKGNLHEYRKGMEAKYGEFREREIWEDRHHQVITWDKEKLVDMIFYYNSESDKLK